MNSNQASGRDRALYEKVLKLAPKGVIPMMATLREQAVLANNNTTYKFSFNEQKATPKRTEILLSIKDSFYVNSLSLGILVERKTKPGSGVVTYFPDAYTIAIGGNANYTDLESVYNGTLKAQIDRDVLMEKISTSRFRHVPQRTSSEASFSGGVTYGSQAQHEQNYGLVHIEPNIVLRGTKNNEFTLTLPQFDVTPNIASSDPAFEVSVVLQAQGFLIPGGAGLVNN
jgi:hypothetical protein